MKKIGTLAPLFSLISEETNQYGVIENGKYFIDWLAKTKQSTWQMLPLHDRQLIPNSSTDHVLSPYRGYGIGLNPEYLSKEAKAIAPSMSQLNAFITREEAWIHDYVLFCALRDKFGTDDWRRWDPPLRGRDPKALKKASSDLKEQIKKHTIEQFQLHATYADLRSHAKKMSISIMGDMSFYITLESPLAWINQHCFLLNKDFSLPRVSGVAYGKDVLFGRQVWGHPLYDWENKNVLKDILSLWKLRLTYATTLFDHLRIDHANGFYFYGSLDPINEDIGEMKDGPGEKVFEELFSHSKNIGLDLFAEDAALRVSRLRETMQKLDIAGIRVLRFAYDHSKKRVSEQYLHTEMYPRNSIAYTTSHDTPPLISFLDSLSEETKKHFATVHHAMYKNDRELAITLRDAVLASPSRIIILPIQDWLLTSERINTPGTENIYDDKNWRYKVPMTIEALPDVSPLLNRIK